MMFPKRKKGQGMVEYILIIALIALIVIVGVKMLGKKTQKAYNDSAGAIESNVQEGVDAADKQQWHPGGAHASDGGSGGGVWK